MTNKVSRHRNLSQFNITKGAERPSWDDVWMSCSRVISARSYDPRHRVGTVIVTEDNTQMLSVGYNGNYSGGPNEVESDVPGESGLIHAEINALIHKQLRSNCALLSKKGFFRFTLSSTSKFLMKWQ